MTTVLIPATAAQTLPLAPGPVPDEPVWRLTVEQYHEMLHAGILHSGDPVELLEGILVAKMTKYPPHTLSTQLTREALQSLFKAGWYVNDQEPITTLDSEPEPDVSVIRGARRDFLDRHPGPQDLALVVEIADTTLRRDRGRKKRLYARAGIPQYWIVNLVDRQLEVYTAPSGPADEPDYGQRQVFGPTDAVPVVVDGTEVGRLTVSDLLP
jgi:Uma2 family endonuclease